MAVTDILVGNFSTQAKKGFENQLRHFQQFQKQFKKVGQDLILGNMAAARTDFAALQTIVHWDSSTSSSQDDDPIVQAFSRLSQDMQSGNLAAARQDYALVQLEFQE